MDFEDLLELARDSYVGQFLTFADQQVVAQPDGTLEAKLVVTADAGLYRELYCADFVYEDDGGKIVELTPDEEVSFEPVVATLGDMQITLERLNWHDVSIEITDRPDTSGLQGIDAWFETWFDPDEQNPDLDSRFSGHIHSLLVDGVNLHVDFGTAPVQALIDLLLLLEMNACAAIRVF